MKQYQYFHYDFHEMSENTLLQLSQFVVTTNYLRHTGALPPFVDEEIQEVQQEGLYYAPLSCYYIAKNNVTNALAGCIRVIRWDKQCVLPIEKKFGVCIAKLVAEHNAEQVFHIGGFAISDKETKRMNVILFKTLLVLAFTVCLVKNAIVFAELDKHLLSILQLLNISSLSLGQSKIELGSETIPAYINAEGFKPFIEKHKYLIYHV